MKTRLTILILTLFFASSCFNSLIKSPKWDVTYPEEIEPQVKLFIENAPDNVRSPKLTIVLMGNLPLQKGKTVAGYTSKKENTIYLDTLSSQWAQSRYAFVLHELGHFVLKRDHNDNLTTVLNVYLDYPESIMNSFTPEPYDEELLRNDRLMEFYMDELFEK